VVGDARRSADKISLRNLLRHTSQVEWQHAPSHAVDPLARLAAGYAAEFDQKKMPNKAMDRNTHPLRGRVCSWFVGYQVLS
jgi:CubicO group peptidase (beta-lactamase class C family)